MIRDLTKRLPKLSLYGCIILLCNLSLCTRSLTCELDHHILSLSNETQNYCNCRYNTKKKKNRDILFKFGSSLCGSGSKLYS